MSPELRKTLAFVAVAEDEPRLMLEAPIIATNIAPSRTANAHAATPRIPSRLSTSSGRLAANGPLTRPAM